MVALGNQSAICWLRRGLRFRLAICFIQHFDGAIHNRLLIPVDAFEACCDPAVGIKDVSLNAVPVHKGLDKVDSKIEVAAKAV
jgi:hypothetical protein